MSVQTSSGGSARDKHFVDTVKAWTSTGTEDPHLSVTIFQQDTNNIAGTTTDTNTWLQCGLSNLIRKWAMHQSNYINTTKSPASKPG